MSIEVINRFNGGNGGVSVIISHETGRPTTGIEEVETMGEFMTPRKAFELGILILEKACHSSNFNLPAELAEALNNTKQRLR